MAFILHSPCARPRPESAHGQPHPPALRGTMDRLRCALLPMAIALYCVAIPGLLAVGMEGALGRVFAALAAVGAGLWLIGMAGRERPVRPSRW